MRITAIKPYPVHVGHRLQLLVKIETDEGVYGWGESGLSSREQAVIGAVNHYAGFVVGQDPYRIGRIWQEIYRSQYFEGGRVLTAAISAIDIALHDLKAKALGVPVYELLGGRQRDLVPTFASFGGSSVAEVVERGRDLLDQGWVSLRVARLGGTPSDDPEVYDPWLSLTTMAPVLAEVRQELGTGVNLGIDFHHRLSVAEAASLCQRLPVGTLDWIEEPIRDETPEAYETLRRMTPIPFAIGEEFASKWQFLPYIERGITQYARLDICNVGGFTEAMKVAGWCEAHYIDLMPHNPLGPICTAATVHLAAAVPNFSWVEVRGTSGERRTNTQESPIFREQLALEHAHYPVPSTPGLGVEIDEDALADAVATSWHEPQHLRRPDGSVTNW